jgi:phosphotriesterase-related protein
VPDRREEIGGESARGTVQTLRGPVAGSELGFTLAHEHLVSLSVGARRAWPAAYSVTSIVRQVVDRIAAASALGVRTIVDQTTVDLGRDLELVMAIADQAEVNLIAATGAWLRPSRVLQELPAERVADLFCLDLEQGIEGSHVRAGVIKVASDGGIQPPFRTAFDAAAIAHRRTGAPIVTHSVAARGEGLEQARYLLDRGVAPSKVLIGHAGDITDVDPIAAIAQLGVFVGLDRFGLDRLGEQALPTAEERTSVAVELCRRGFQNSIVLSHDASGFSDVRTADTEARDHPGWKFTLIPGEVVPALAEAGVETSAIHAMTVSNPARLLSVL